MRPFRSALVTGATGLIGSALTLRLAQEGIKVYGLLRARSKQGLRLKRMPGVEYVEVPSFHTQGWAKALGGFSPEVVFHLAAYGVNNQDRDPCEMIEGNVNLVAQVLLAATRWRLKRFVYTGSCSEYGCPSKRKPISEDHPLWPTSLYGAAKAASVLYGNALSARLGIPFVTLRLFGVYGPGEGPKRLIPYLIDHLHRGVPVDLTPGEQCRDLLYIDDVVDALLAAARCRDIPVNTVYNVCSGRPVRVREIAHTVARVMNKPTSLLQLGKRSYRKDEPMWIVGDNRRFKATTDWKPKVTLLEGIRRMIQARCTVAIR